MLVGLIANPEAGHDVRRVVSHASTFNNQEKVYIIRRLLMGLAAAGVERVLYLPEPIGLVRFALDGGQYVVAAAGDTLWAFVMNSPRAK